MPTLPTINAQRNVTAQTAEPLRNEVEQKFAPQNAIIKTVTDMTQKWSDANDVMQYTDAKAKYELAVSEIHSRAVADPDFTKGQKYQQELDAAKNKSLEGVSNVEVRNKASVEFNYNNQLTNIKIDSEFKKKQLIHNEYQLKNYLNEQQLKKVGVSDNERQDIENNIDLNLNMQVATGLITQEQADKIKYNSEKDAATNLIYTNPSVGAQAVKDGYFKSLTAEDTGKLISEANQIEKKQQEIADYQLKQTQLKGAIDLSTALYNKTLTPAMVRDLQQSGAIDPDTASIFYSAALNKTYEVPQGTSLVEPDYFLRLLDDSHGDKVQIDKILRDAAKAYTDHKIGVNQYQYLIQDAQETFDRQSKGIFTKSAWQQNIQGSVHAIKSFGKSFFSVGGDVAKETGKMVSKFFDRFKPGDDPNKVKSEIIDERLTEEIEKSKTVIPKAPVRMVTPDGRMIEVDAKKVDAALKRGLKYAR